MSIPTSAAIRVCIVDDDPFVTLSLRTILNAQPDIVVAGEGHSGSDAIDLYQRTRPDVLLMDIQMPGTDGLAAAERILEAHALARVVFLTTFADDEYIVRALRLGAAGYLIKQEVATIAPALRAVMAGQSVMEGVVLDRVDALVRASDARDVPSHPLVVLSGLSKREQAIVELVAQGLDNKEIAATLYIGEGTVRNHISTMLQKLALKNRTQLAVAYYRRG